MRAWVRDVSHDGRYGRLEVPWVRDAPSGWVDLRGSHTVRSRMLVVGDLSQREVRVFEGCREVLRVPGAIGAAASPSPTGRMWVTDEIAVPSSQPQFGSYAFGLSAIQPHTPVGWTGGNQMAIHGTNDPGSIGQSVSAGCLRVSEDALTRLLPLIQPGTPVIIQQ